MKLIYYGFGAFIGFICGTVINLIFFMVEKSGNPVLSSLPQKYGAFGYYISELTNYLPLFGLALGIVMVRILFQEQWDREQNEE